VKYTVWNRSRFGCLGLCVFIVSAGLAVPAANAQGTNTTPSTAAASPKPAAASTKTATASTKTAVTSTNSQQKPKQEPIKEPVTASGCKTEPGRPYFVEFRSRTAVSYGHTFVFHGRLGAPGKFGKFQVAGLHPKGDDPDTYIKGHWVPVPSETGVSYGDLDEQYLTARYCVVLTEAEYNKVVAFIRKLQVTSPTWQATGKNCNSFAGDIAESMGLRSPPSMLLPETYIKTLRSMNNERTNLTAVAKSYFH
jgi:hypothetical protein